MDEEGDRGMVTLFGGIVALVLGFIGLIVWWPEFVDLLLAGIPLVLLLGGALATYLGIEEWKDKQSMAAQSAPSFPDAEAERYKAEAEKYKRELEEMKKSPPEEKPAEESGE